MFLFLFVFVSRLLVPPAAFECECNSLVGLMQHIFFGIVGQAGRLGKAELGEADEQVCQGT